MNQNSHSHLALVEGVGETKGHGEPARRADKYSFAKYLRAIGQSLDAQNLASFELAYHSGVYVVRSVTARKWSMKNFFANRRVLSGHEPVEQGSPAPVQMHYSAEAVEALDAVGRTQRGKNHETPDPFSISEQLRSVGSFIDSDPQRSFVSVTSHGKRLEIRYESEKGGIRKITRRMEHHFDAWKELFQRRKNRIKRVK
jgi:hypothetical protein